MNAHFRQNLTSESRDLDFSSLGVLTAAVKLTVVAGENLTVGWARQRLFFIKNPGQLELYVEGLRKAGIPL
jgi:hypothetical protein